jgi:hypothetical protein
VPETGILEVMIREIKTTENFIHSIPEEMHDFRYAPDKWSVREVLGHISDTERAFGYRALCFGRGDYPEFKRIDGGLYIKNGEFSRLTMRELLDEFEAARRSNALMLKHLPEEAWDRSAEVYGAKVTVRALAYLMVGHERHHLNIICNLYLKMS